MSGNVWEWTRTPFQPGGLSVEEKPVDLMADALWVMRGGSYMDAERSVRAATRGGADPGVRREFIGFRVAVRKDGD
jgi:formylglycine-generating enzyme required for sulfatase activity